MRAAASRVGCRPLLGCWRILPDHHHFLTQVTVLLRAYQLHQVSVTADLKFHPAYIALISPPRDLSNLAAAHDPKLMAREFFIRAGRLLAHKFDREIRVLDLHPLGITDLCAIARLSPQRRRRSLFMTANQHGDDKHRSKSYEI